VTPRPVDARELPALTWSLHAAHPHDSDEPGAPVPSRVVTLLSSRREGVARVDRIRAPGGLVFLRVDGRGRAGEQCAPSWIRIESFPGYASSEQVPVLAIPVPTCRATRAGTVTIGAGLMIYGGPGEPASPRYAEDPDHRQPEQHLWLGRFAIDRTEVSNGEFAVFARLANVTGYPAPIYPNKGKHARQGDPQYPVTEINAYQAEAYCRYLGKHLPSDHQWVKAARGGLTIDGVANPAPRRLYPSGLSSPACVNQQGDADGHAWVAPVDALACGASPYGVLNLAGNVQEWISRRGQVDRDEPLHAMRGGAAHSPPELHHVTTIFRNHRDPRNFDYSIGFRCVEDGGGSDARAR